MLALDQVWFSYGAAPVLYGVTAAVNSGETVALLGRNGVGKTTLTKLVVGLLRPTRGAVSLAGRPIEGLAPEDVAQLAAYVFQHPEQQLFARTVLDEVAFAPRQRGATELGARRLATDALARLGLGQVADRHPYDLAPAQRKLVAFAAALAQEPQVLVLDEPTLGFDRVETHRVSRLIAELSAAGTTVIAVTHDLAFVAETLERSIVLSQGRCAFDGPSSTLLRGAERIEALGLELPPAVRLSRELQLDGSPVRVADVARAIEERCRGLDRSVSSPSADDQP